MSILTRVILIGLVIVAAAGLAAVAIWDIPPPTHKVEKVLPDERFPR